MKIIVIIISVSLIVCYANGQEIDSVYTFFPKLNAVKGPVRNLDSIILRRSIYAFKIDSADSSIVWVSRFNKRLQLIESGRYLFDKQDVAGAHVFDRKTGATYLRPEIIELRYLRHGYWSYYKNGEEKRVYYDKGELIKLKIK